MDAGCTLALPQITFTGIIPDLFHTHLSSELLKGILVSIILIFLLRRRLLTKLRSFRPKIESLSLPRPSDVVMFVCLAATEATCFVFLMLRIDNLISRTETQLFIHIKSQI